MATPENPDSGRPSAQPQATQLAALGALTTELVAARHTLEALPTRGEVESRLAEERADRRRAFRWLALAVILLLGSYVLAVIERGEIHDIAADARATAEDLRSSTNHSEKILRTIECVVRAVATLEPAEQPPALRMCLNE